jgi:hypothetical protein
MNWPYGSYLNFLLVVAAKNPSIMRITIIIKYMILKNVLSATCKFQGISMYKWCDFLQRYSTLINDSMKIKDVLAEIEDSKAELLSYFSRWI